MTKKKVINPTFYYNNKNQPVLVRLTIKDFNYFYAKLERLSIAAKKQAAGLCKDK